ncbi:hypothetical protein THAOC_29013, partial [Thalassiosira oceanica]
PDETAPHPTGAGRWRGRDDIAPPPSLLAAQLAGGHGRPRRPEGGVTPQVPKPGGRTAISPTGTPPGPVPPRRLNNDNDGTNPDVLEPMAIIIENTEKPSHINARMVSIKDDDEGKQRGRG